MYTVEMKKGEGNEGRMTGQRRTRGEVSLSIKKSLMEVPTYTKKEENRRRKESSFGGKQGMGQVFPPKRRTLRLTRRNGAARTLKNKLHGGEGLEGGGGGRERAV